VRPFPKIIHHFISARRHNIWQMYFMFSRENRANECVISPGNGRLYVACVKCYIRGRGLLYGHLRFLGVVLGVGLGISQTQVLPDVAGRVGGPAVGQGSGQQHGDLCQHKNNDYFTRLCSGAVS
jgi:hypothetical protein